MSFGGGGFGGFGNNNNQQQQSTGFGGFGGSANNTAGGFGSTGSAFGANNNPNNATGSTGLFGSSATANTGGGFGTSGGFGGAASTSSPFGAKPAFGAPAASTTTGGGLFGNNTATSGSGFGGFGGTANNTASAPAFGAPANTGSSLFGQQNKPAFGTGSTGGGGGLFGGGNTAPSTGFGAPAATNTAGFGSTPGFGASAQQAQNTGTAATPFQAHVEKDGTTSANSHYQSITFQQPYQNFSFEELRLADYNAGRRFGNSNGQAGAFGTTSGFGGFGGSTATTNPAGGFGAPAPTSGGLFGSNNAAPANTASPFGQTTTPSTGFGGSTGGGGGGLFGAKPAGTSMFGAAPAATNTTSGGLFGTSGTNTAGTGFGGGFGANNTANSAPSGGLFGAQNNQQQKPAFGGFGGAATGTTGGFGQPAAGSTPAFGAQTNTTGGGLFGGSTNNNNNAAPSGGLFGQQNQQQAQQPQQQQQQSTGFGGFGQNNNQNQQQSTTGTGGLFGGSFGQNNQNQQKPSLFGAPTAGATTGTSLFGQNNQNQQQNTSGGLFGGQNNQQNNTGGGLFGQNKPAGSLFGAPAAGAGTTGTATGGLFGGLGQNNQQQNTGGGLFGASQQNQQKPGGLFGGLGNNTGTTGTGSLFGGGASTGGGSGGLFGSTNNQQQGSSLFGNSQQGQQQQQQQQQQPSSLQASLFSNPYGNDQLFTNMGTPTAPVGPLATPLSGAQKSAKRPAPLPQFKINPSASLRLITPQKRSNGYGFSYSTYNTPGSGPSSLSTGLGASMLQSGGLSRSLGRSFSTTNLRNTFSPDSDSSSVLAPGAFTPNSRPYAGGSIRRLKIDRNLRTDLFGDGHASEPSSLIKKRVSFHASEEKGKSPVANGEPAGNASNALVRTETNESAEPTPEHVTPPATNGTQANGTVARPQMEQVRGNELATVPEGQTVPISNGPSKVQPDQEPGTYWMSPSLQDLRNMSREQLKNVHGFTVGRVGIGKIEFDDVDLTTVPLDDILGGIVNLNTRSATVYETGVNTPPVGKGLNVPSTITLENSWPRSHAGATPVHERKGPRYDKHVERLKRVTNTEFISYNPEDGVWVFRVPHYTTYGVPDEDDDDEIDYTGQTHEQSPTPNAGHTPAARDNEMSEVSNEYDASDMSAEESNPDDTFDFKKGPSKSLPGGFNGNQSIYQDEDMADDSDAQDDDSSYLEQRGTSALEDPFRSSGSDSAALAVQAEELPVDEEVTEQDLFAEPAQSQNGFGASFVPKSILKQSTIFGTPKKDFAVTGDWAEQLQRTVSPKKKDRAALRERQADNMGAAPADNAPFAASIAGKAFNTTMDIMNSLWGAPPLSTDNALKNSAAGKGFEWPYPKRTKTNDAFADMSETDAAFHTSVKPSWTTDNTLVYAIAGNAPAVAGNISTAKRSIVSEGKDIRFAKFNLTDAVTQSLAQQLSKTPVALVQGIPVAQQPEDITFTALASSVMGDNPHAKHEHAVWKVASILFDPIQTSCASFVEGLPAERLPELEHRIRRDALSAFWSDIVNEDATLAARDAVSSAEKALAYMSGGNVEEACAALVEGGNLRLATIVGQYPRDSKTNEMIGKQIDAWRTQNVLSEIAAPIRAIYDITAGNVCVSEGKSGASEDRAPTFNISSQYGLDWRRSFGLRLWFGKHETDSLADAVQAYADDVSSGKEQVQPIPFFTEQGLNMEWDDPNPSSREDTLFGLLKLYARKPSQDLSLVELLSPASVSGNPLDARLAWQLATLLLNKELVTRSDVPDGMLDALTMTLSAQLENANELTLALNVMIHLTTPGARAENARSLLYRRASALSDPSNPDALPTALTHELLIPQAWLWHARALFARSVLEDHISETAFLLRAGDVPQAHQVLCRIVGPAAVVSQDYDALRELLGGFEEQHLSGQVARAEGWGVGGQVYFDFVHLLDLQGKGGHGYGHAQARELKQVLDRLVKALPGMLANSAGKKNVGLEERVAVGIMAAAVKSEVEQVAREEKGIDTRSTRLDRLPTAGDDYAKKGIDLSRTFYEGITA